MEMTNIINQMMILFLIMLVGYIANKKQILTEENNKVLSKLIVHITSPALIINTVTSGTITGSKQETATIIGISFLFYGIIILLAKLICFLVRVKGKERKEYEAMLVFTNLGFMGIPVIDAIYGNQAVFYISIFMIPFNILMFSYGIWLLSSEKETSFELKRILNPCVIAAMIALVIYFFDLKTHVIFNSCVESIGQITSPLAMIVIGVSIALVPLKEVFLDYKIYIFGVIKCFLMPVLMLLLFRPFLSNEMLLGVIVVITGMPVGSNVGIVNTEYGGNSRLVSKGIIISNLVCLASIPVLAILL